MQVSHHAAKFKSFKFSVLVGQVNTALNEDFWPRGVRIKKFKNKRFD